MPTLVARMSPTGNGYRVLCRAEAGEYVDLNQASDGRTVVISRESHAGNHLLLLPPGAAAPVVLWNSQPGDQVQFDTATEHDWLLHTSPGDPDRLLLRRGGGDWQLRCTAAPGSYWEQVVAVPGAALLVERQGGGQRLRIVSAGSSTSDPVEIRFGSDEELAALFFVPGFDPAGVAPVVVRTVGSPRPGCTESRPSSGGPIRSIRSLPHPLHR